MTRHRRGAAIRRVRRRCSQANFSAEKGVQPPEQAQQGQSDSKGKSQALSLLSTKTEDN